MYYEQHWVVGLAIILGLTLRTKDRFKQLSVMIAGIIPFIFTICWYIYFISKAPRGMTNTLSSLLLTAKEVGKQILMMWGHVQINEFIQPLVLPSQSIKLTLVAFLISLCAIYLLRSEYFRNNNIKPMRKLSMAT